MNLGKRMQMDLADKSLTGIYHTLIHVDMLKFH